MGTTHKLVSVIVPVFNVFPWLREALDSLVLQTWRPLEILLVDDGSADGSGEICDEYARRWPDLIRVFHQDNRGLSAARNTGLQRMTGEIVSFLDPDDAFCPEMIEKTMEALLHHHADIAVCGYAVCRTGKKMAGAGRRRAEVPEREVLSSGDALRRLAQGKINQAVWNKLYVRRLWESLRFPEGRVYEDVSTTYQVLSSAETIVTIPDALVLHRTRPGSITQTRSLRNLRDWMTAMDQYVAFVREKTPEIYDVEQMNLIQEARLRSMIVHWSAIPFSEQKAAEDIRTEILAAGHRQLALSGRFRTRAAYFLIRFCPRLIPILMPVYRPIRLFIHRVTGR